ncbi:hydrogenase small subunit [Thermobrachium celere]|uniref:[Ni/Fe] hydrogenase, group 1, small subunit n=1 Tax=Thermobrachium celere DSM 8682 TaxID=941824 RepID=R7RTL3_9CLOT|nr:[Ni/Fe] hydrogenase, group 1, small subunit [Thermobrachium celere]CDF58570.1 [Ni/Fe] hydrogenase, group 1, small subunit [Thermobrachium celere DSM 8682]
MELIWLEANGCSGNIISFLNSQNPSFGFLKQKINITFSNSDMYPYGEAAMEDFFKTVENGNYILVVEGAIATRENGKYNIIGYYNNQYVTALEAVKIASENAKYIISAGTCSCFGGISASDPNISESKALSEVIPNKMIIKMPGCPVSGNWMASLLLSLLENKAIELDPLGRPIYLYGNTVHDFCERRTFFERNIFAKKVGDIGCYLKIGCVGPSTKAPCPYTKWNGYIKWPIGVNSQCIGCTSKDFPNYTLFKEE